MRNEAVAVVIEPRLETPERIARLADEWARRCLGAGAPPSAVLTDADFAALDAEERAFFVRVGCVSATNDALHRWRGVPATEARAGGPRRTPMHAVQGRNPTIWRGLGIVLQGADAALKPLLNFTRDDLARLAEESATQRAAWQRRQAWAKAALGAVTKHNRAAVSELPAEELAALDAGAVEAWRR